jgi:TatD DNase family protein
MINIGTNYQTSKKAKEIAQRYKRGIYASIGLHPIHLETGLVKIKNNQTEIESKTKENFFDYEKYKALASSKKVVAIGEIGLDYYWRPKSTKKKELFKQKQRDLLSKQLELARELELPVVFHSRLSHKDLIKFLKENENLRPKKRLFMVLLVT